ncbi:MAG: hypothetical protein K1X68_13590 [Saprospiraceae bacterium]|nr:hypothetical protein [Saprospiraceae bacterium]HMW39284.1 hypothetical protein [Saprospiraceae bacterium]HMX89082.1 hypothetical protein [Saprospiraceae bacterium]HMZ40953.1 hypothetical protein [Saprospiraceae bacterium]HNB30436.1 hypothetical protein [Saprospiraceae bacterium]
MKNKYILPILLVGAALAFWWWNNKKIEDLRLQLAAVKQAPLPARTDVPGWTKIIQILLGLGMDVYKEFRSGGAFYNGSNTLGDLDIDEIIKSIA